MRRKCPEIMCRCVSGKSADVHERKVLELAEEGSAMRGFSGLQESPPPHSSHVVSLVQVGSVISCFLSERGIDKST